MEGAGQCLAAQKRYIPGQEPLHKLLHCLHACLLLLAHAPDTGCHQLCHIWRPIQGVTLNKIGCQGSRMDTPTMVPPELGCAPRCELLGAKRMTSCSREGKHRLTFIVSSGMHAVWVQLHQLLRQCQRHVCMQGGQLRQPLHSWCSSF